MTKISLRDYQKEAVKFAVSVPKSLLCMRVGSGKTICAMFTLRYLLNHKLTDKAIVACTKSSVSVFKEDFKEKANLDVRLIEDPDELYKFLNFSKEKICLVKHSMFEKAGNDIISLRKLGEVADEGVRVTLVIDEAHKLQNPQGVAHEAYERMSFLFERVTLLTATPYSSCLSQFYGLIHLIYPNLWKNKTAFFNRYIEEITIKDPKTFRVVRKEKIGYRNLKEFRALIEPFTYFYYPKVPIVHVEHHTRLENYEEYNKLCRGILDDSTKEKIEKLKEKEDVEG